MPNPDLRHPCHTDFTATPGWGVQELCPSQRLWERASLDNTREQGVAMPSSVLRSPRAIMETAMETVPMHPLLAKLSAERIAGVAALSGYAGPGSTSEHIKLYPRLDDLSGSFEIALRDIVHFEKAPESLLPFGGTTVWIHKDAQVVSSSVKQGTAVVEQDKAFDEMKSGRLHIRMRKQLQADDCSSGGDCSSRCHCTSVCCILRPPQ
jgi:hypothetical protein